MNTTFHKGAGNADRERTWVALALPTGQMVFSEPQGNSEATLIPPYFWEGSMPPLLKLFHCGETASSGDRPRAEPPGHSQCRLLGPIFVSQNLRSLLFSPHSTRLRGEQGHWFCCPHGRAWWQWTGASSVLTSPFFPHANERSFQSVESEGFGKTIRSTTQLHAGGTDVHTESAIGPAVEKPGPSALFSVV